LTGQRKFKNGIIRARADFFEGNNNHLCRWQIDQNTVLVFLSDNSHSIGDLYNAGMRGMKGTPYEGGTRVPCFWH